MKLNLPPMAEKLKPVSDIPNTDGFRLTLVGASGAEVACVVKKTDNGSHVCIDLRGTYRNCTAFAGWRNRR